MRKVTRSQHRKPVLLTLHDVAVPEHLLLHAKGVQEITITRLNSRMLYKARLLAESPPTTAQLTRRRAVMDAFAGEVCPDCEKEIVIDDDGEPRCTDCALILYPPPSLYLTHIASSYLEAMRDVRPKRVWSSGLTGVFLAHHAAEIYLKALGACTAFTCDGREEFLYGDTFTYNRHGLGKIFDNVHPTIKSRLQKIRSSSGRSILDLVGMVPRGTAELFRYGLLLKDATRYRIKTTVDGSIEFEGTNLSNALSELCELLAEFSHNELDVLCCE